MKFSFFLGTKKASFCSQTNKFLIMTLGQRVSQGSNRRTVERRTDDVHWNASNTVSYWLYILMSIYAGSRKGSRLYERKQRRKTTHPHIPSVSRLHNRGIEGRRGTD